MSNVIQQQLGTKNIIYLVIFQCIKCLMLMLNYLFLAALQPYKLQLKFQVIPINLFRDIDDGSWPKKLRKNDILIYASNNSRPTLIDSVAYLLAYGKTFKNTACACYSNAAINRADTVYDSEKFRIFGGKFKCKWKVQNI